MNISHSPFSFWRHRFCFFTFTAGLKLIIFARKALSKKFSAGCAESYLPTYYLRRIVSLLIQNNAKHQLVYLCAGRINPAARRLEEQKEIFLSHILRAVKGQTSYRADFEKYIKANPNDNAALTELGILYFLAGEKEKAQLCLNNISGRQKKYASARQKYLQAYLDTDDGDMLRASQNASLAAKYFHKLGAEYEEGQSYLLLGIIYRVAIISDVSQMMFETALQIFSAAKCPVETANAYGNLGMLMAIQQRFEEADDYYQKAEKIMLDNGCSLGFAVICNQQSLLQLMQNNNEKAEELALKALKSINKTQTTPVLLSAKKLSAAAHLTGKTIKKRCKWPLKPKICTKNMAIFPPAWKICI